MLFKLFIIPLLLHNALAVTVPIPGRPVYIESTNSIWSFSLSRASQAGNILNKIDLDQSFNTLSPAVTDVSSLIRNENCPIIHFAQAEPDHDGLSINVFGAASYPNGTYSPYTAVCQLNTTTQSWNEIIKPNPPLARRNAQYDTTTSGQTIMWGGNSEPLTGLTSSMEGYPYFWHSEAAIYDYINGWLPGTQYGGLPRQNGTMTQIRDTDGQIVVLGGHIPADVNYTTSVLETMDNVVLFDPRTQNWNNITAKGNIPPPRIHHTATLLSDGHTIAVIGGETFNSTGDYILNDVYLLDTNTWTWSAPNIQGEGLARSNHTSVLIDGKVWVLAGTNTTAKAVDIQILNVTGWFWTFDHTSNYVAPQRYASVGGVGGIVGIVIGCIVAVAIAFIAFFFWKRRNNRRRNLTAHNTKDMSGTMIYPEVKTVYHNDTVNELQVASKMPSFTEDWNGQQINNTGYFRRSYDHNQGSVHSFHEASYYTEDGYVPQTIGPKSYKEDTSRPISTYWDENSHYQQEQAQPENHILLAPLGNPSYKGQHHQKPNEIDRVTPVPSIISSIHATDDNTSQKNSET